MHVTSQDMPVQMCGMLDVEVRNASWFSEQPLSSPTHWCRVWHLAPAHKH